MVECDEPSVEQDYNSWRHEAVNSMASHGWASLGTLDEGDSSAKHS